MRKLFFGVGIALLIFGLGVTPGADAAKRTDVLVRLIIKLSILRVRAKLTVPIIGK